MNLFERKYSNNSIKLHLTYIQLLGNVATDLLKENAKVDILEDKFGKVNILGAREEEVKSTDDFVRLSAIAADHRSTSTTMKNDTSSRSHAICRIRLQNTESRKLMMDFFSLLI